MSRLGRGRPAQGIIRGLRPFEARTGFVAMTGGGAVTASPATRVNYVANPSFEVNSAGWATSAFTVTPGAILSTGSGFASNGTHQGVVDTSSQFNGVCYAPTDLGTFLSGVTYYAQIDIEAVTPGDTLEIVLGSTSDDYASKQFTVTGTYQTVQVAWTPSADRSASNHGLAVRTTMTGGAANNEWFIDSAAIGTAPGYIDGTMANVRWLGAANASISELGGGKGSHGSVTASSGGAVATGFLQSSATGSTFATGGGSIATAGVKNGRVAVAQHGGGSLVTSGSATQITGFLFGVMSGGGGRVARSHPAVGIAHPGIIPTSMPTTARTGTTSCSAGGSVTTATTKGGRSSTADTGGGFLATTAAKTTLRALAITGGGSIVLSAVATPAPGGIIGGGMLMGGGGRFGRSHVGGVISHGQPTLTIASTDNRSGSMAGTGGGSITTVGRKGSISTTPVAIPAPPPELVDVLLLAGVLVHGAGSITIQYNRSASQIGSVAIAGGGSIATTASRQATGTAAQHGGGSLTLTVRKGARAATTTTGGGSITTTYVLGQSNSDVTAMSGGGSVRTTGVQNGKGSTSATAGGTLRTIGIRKASGTTSTTGGGSLTLTGSQFGRQATGITQTHGGGSVNLSTTKLTRGTTSTTGGGSGAARGARGAIGSVAVTGGGSLRTVRVNVPIPIYAGLVDADLEEEIGIPVLLRR